MARIFSVEDRSWTDPAFHDWLRTIGLEDCAPILKAHNVSAEDFPTYRTDLVGLGLTAEVIRFEASWQFIELFLQNLKEHEVMTWTELPLVRRRQLVELMHRLKTKSSKTLANRNSQSNMNKEARIKRLFGTLTNGLKKRTPLPLPTDYSNQSSALRDIQSLKQESHDTHLFDKEQNDWGSEFSDSEEEETDAPQGNFQVRGSPVFSKKPLGVTRSISATAVTIESQVPHIAESVSFARRPDRENVYEVPQEFEGEKPPKPADKPVQLRHFARSVSMSNTAAAVPAGSTNPSRRLSEQPNLQQTRQRLDTSEIAEKLNVLLGKSSTGSSGSTSTLKPSTSPSLSHRSLQTVSSRTSTNDPFTCYPWYHGDISRGAASQFLRSLGVEGAFLVRKSHTGAERFSSPYSMSLLSLRKVHHLTIRLRYDGRFALGFEKKGEQAFASVEDLVDFHMHEPVYLNDGDRGVILLDLRNMP